MIAPSTPGRLTRRELEVARLVARCLTNKEIARALALSEQTVKNHLRNAYRRLRIDSRVALTLWVLCGAPDAPGASRRAA